ncbi:MAG: hypothetical protein SNH01_06190 [Rikenellaceae bacterium]
MEKLLSVVLLIIGMLLGFLLGERCSVEPSPEVEVVSEVVCDTLLFRDIPPVEVRHVVPKTSVVASPASVNSSRVEPLLEYHFRDTIENSWSAVVRGRDVELSEMIVTSKSTITTQFRDPKWSVALVGAVGADAVWGGVEVTRAVRKNLSISLTAGYDPIHRNLHTQLGARMTLWRE